MRTAITCPKCDHEFDVENAISSKLEIQFQEKLKNAVQEERKSFSKKEETLKAFQDQLQKQKDDQAKIIRESVKKEEQRLRILIQNDISEENEELILNLKDQLTRQKDAQRKAVKEKLELEKLMEDLKDREKDLENEINKKVLEKTREMKSKVEKKEQEKHYLELKEREELIENLKKRMIDMQRKVEQGSMQAQGEILELEVERILNAIFPLDVIDEVKKGQNGADCLHHVRNTFGKIVGTVSYETKRTKSFSRSWIEKHKSDMRIHKAGIGVIVTEVMPEGMRSFGLLEGIWICKFQEVEGLAKALRQTLIKVSEVEIANDGKEEKMQVLYNYLTSSEFSQPMQAIVRSFVNLKDQIETEKRAMKRQWKQREKQLEIIIDGATDMYGSIKGIAGNSISEIPELEFPKPENLINQ